MQKITIGEAVLGFRGFAASLTQLLATITLAKAAVVSGTVTAHPVLFYLWIVSLALPAAINGVLPASGLIDPLVERLPRGRRYEQIMTVVLTMVGVAITFAAPWALLWGILQMERSSTLGAIFVYDKVALAWVGIQVGLIHLARVGWRRRTGWMFAFNNANIPASN